MSKTFHELARAAEAHFPGTAFQAENDVIPKLHLYHAPNSICSQKVRAVLLATRQPFISHTLDIFKGETYTPAYVRLRMEGCSASGLSLAKDHPGTTSATSTGCDACVVPTIVAADTGEIIVDSKRICIELDRRNSAAPGNLMPEEFRELIEAELAIVDNLPKYQLLAVAIGKPNTAAADNSFAISKVRRCEALMAEHCDDKVLYSAYAAKRAKEQAASERLFDGAALEQARQLIKKALRELDTRLQKIPGPFIFGSSLTMADIFWGVELIRINDLGMSSWWSESHLASLSSYYMLISEHPAVAGAVTQWPDARLKIGRHV
jgi:2,5-dichlorohydroquinone reductive dechlorinase